jgi:hypothetical protein
VRCSLLEPYLARAVASVASLYEPRVSIGSYPHFAQAGDEATQAVKTIITVEGHDLAQVEAATDSLLSSISPEAILSVLKHSTLPSQD